MQFESIIAAYRKMKIWYSIFKRTPYRGTEPDFYSNDSFPWTKNLQDNWELIQAELDAHLKANTQFNSQKKQQRIHRHGLWKTMPMMTWGVKFHRNLHNFPKTYEVLKQIPGLASASFNLMEKNSKINKHFGETNASIRVHLGLHIPDQLPKVGFEVNGLQRSWEEGNLLIFCDGFEHSAWNNSNEDRYILLLDIVKPEFIHRKRFICASVLAALSLQSIATKKRSWFYLSLIPITVLHFLAKCFAVACTPIYNLVKRPKTT